MLRYLLVFIIRKIYQPISRNCWTRTCRFNPTCSEYTAQAIEKYGSIKGTWLGIKRIFRCHPWSKGGDDPLK
ncbi:MAG: membrane protein insertion efficiency factor YidD [Armatimonadota bacterium]